MDNPPADIPTPEENVNDDLVLDQSQVIDHDLPCRQCGYNLRGMAADKLCPECGTEVGRSLLGDQLRYSEPRWVRKLARGLRWIFISVIMLLLMIASGMLMLPIMIFLGDQFGLIPFFMAALGLLMFVCPVCYLLGVWFLTSREPLVIEPSELNVRSILRWSVVLAVLTGFINTMLLGSVSITSGIFSYVPLVMHVVGAILLFIYTRRLALRAPDYELASQTRNVMWGLTVTFVGIVGFQMLETVLSGPTTSNNIVMWLSIPVCMLTIGLLVFVIRTFFLLNYYRRVFNQTITDAEQTWAGETPLPPASD